MNRWRAIVNGRRIVEVVVLVVVGGRRVVVVMRGLQFVDQRAEFVHQQVVGRHVQIHPRFHHLLAVLVFADLQRQQRVDVNQAEIHATTAQRMTVRINRGVRTVRTDRITCAAGRQTEGYAERGPYFQAGRSVLAVVVVSATAGAQYRNFTLRTTIGL